MKREDCLAQYTRFPRQTFDGKNEGYYYPKSFRSYILTLQTNSLNAHVKLLTTQLKGLLNNLGTEKIIFLGDNPKSWLSKSSLHRADYKPLTEAVQYFQSNKIGAKFNGAIEVPLLQLPAFVKHLFYLTRCDASLPYIYFTNTNEGFIACVCQYGNVHLNTFSKKADEKFTQSLSTSKFKIPTSDHCFPSFSTTYAIKGRR